MNAPSEASRDYTLLIQPEHPRWNLSPYSSKTNRARRLRRITRFLADAEVNICWVTIANSGSFGVMKFLVDKLDVAVRQPSRKRGLWSRSSRRWPSRPPLADAPVDEAVADCLGRHHINLANCSGFVAHNCAILILEVHELAQARFRCSKPRG